MLLVVDRPGFEPGCARSTTTGPLLKTISTGGLCVGVDGLHRNRAIAETKPLSFPHTCHCCTATTPRQRIYSVTLLAGTVSFPFALPKMRGDWDFRLRGY